eukprot:scaffold115542_cov45-Phaeocystis_antarctica.AAC.1
MATQTVGRRKRLSKIPQESVSQGPPVHWGVEYNNLARERSLKKYIEGARQAPQHIRRIKMCSREYIQQG